MSENLQAIADALYAVHKSQHRSEAEAFLSQCETNTPGFYQILQHIYMSESFEEDTRTLAVIYFKNGIEKYWRRTAKNAIPEDQKSAIRSLLFLTTASIPISVARQNSIAISRIARGDYPLDWPNLFSDLLSTIVSVQHDELLLMRHLETLNYTVKALCSLRLAHSRLNFQTVAPELFTFVAEIYDVHSQRWIGNKNGNLPITSVRISDLTLKILRRLLCFGYDTPYKVPMCRKFFSLLSSHLVPMWEQLSIQVHETTGNSSMRDLVAKNLVHTGKLFLELSTSSMQNSALNYTYVLMPGSMALVGIYWSIVTHPISTVSDDVNRVKIQGMILLKQCIKLIATPDIHLGLMKDDERMEVEEALRILSQDLFAPDSTVNILENLITLFFRLNEEDLTAWDDNPEGWMIEQEDEHWLFSLRPCAEKVFIDLFAQFKSILIEPLLRVLDATSSAQSGSPFLMKEAMYNAVGLAATHLFDNFSLDDFLPQLEAEIQNPNVPTIFKRRILMLTSQWVTVKCSEKSRALVYKIVGVQLDSAETGICLSAAFAVQKILDDWEWTKDGFEPFSAHYIRCLVKCLEKSEEMETKMRILGTIGLICERMGVHTIPEIGGVLSMVPVEWQNSGDQHMIKVALLGLLNRIVLGLKGQAEGCYPIVLPLIQFSTDSANSEHVYLLEEALELWHAILQNAQASNGHLVQLFPVLLKHELLPSATENLGKILYIIESSLLLMGESIYRRDCASQPLLDDMISMLPNLESKALSQFTRVLGFAAQIWGLRSFTSTNITHLTELFLSQHQNAIKEVCLLSLLCQIIVLDASYIINVWMQYSQGDLTQTVVEKFAARFDNIGHSKYRKLCSMALTALIGVGHPCFRAESILRLIGTIWSDVLAEVQSTVDDLIYWADDSTLLEDLEVDTAEINRRKVLSERDPVCTTHLKPYIKAHLQFIDTRLLGVDLGEFLSD